jgi:hypothetical protein
MNFRRTRQRGPTAVAISAATCLLFFSLCCTQVAAAPVLRCDVTYADTTHHLETAVGSAPYTTPGVDIAGRFRFKAVVLGSGRRIDAVKLYAYYEGSRQPTLLEEVKYLPPFAHSASPYALTGLHSLYAPPLGRELQYGCALQEAKR